MENLPSMWREELLHTKVVHFPIALLLFGTLLFIAAVILNKNDKFSFLMPAARLTLFFGVLGSWASVITGNMADGIATRNLCDPLVVEEHETMAYLVSYIFTGGIVIDLLKKYFIEKIKFKKLFTFLILLIFLTGTGFMFYVGHLGGKLVYQQGAAVYQPSEDCSEFE